MISGNKKLSRGFSMIIIIIIIISVVGWFFWSDIVRLILGSEYRAITTPLAGASIDKDLKQKVISELEKLRQYGEWPISISGENPSRGDPFSPKRQ